MKNLTLAIFTLFLFFSLTTYSQEKNINKLKVFPNPAINVINVLGLKNSNKANITLLDSYGNIVLKHFWEIKNNALNIPVSSLSAGIYVINIQSQEQQFQTKFYKK